jgi:hypothetical protein
VVLAIFMPAVIAAVLLTGIWPGHGLTVIETQGISWLGPVLLLLAYAMGSLAIFVCGYLLGRSGQLSRRPVEPQAQRTQQPSRPSKRPETPY